MNNCGTKHRIMLPTSKLNSSDPKYQGQVSFCYFYRRGSLFPCSRMLCIQKNSNWCYCFLIWMQVRLSLHIKIFFYEWLNGSCQDFIILLVWVGLIFILKIILVLPSKHLYYLEIFYRLFDLSKLVRHRKLDWSFYELY